MAKNKCNDLNGKEWLQNSFSIWRDLKKTKDEKDFKHPASFPVSLCEKVIKTFSKNDAFILDPFNGIGSTMTACANLERKGIGIDLSTEFCDLAKKRVVKNPNISIITGDSIKELTKLPADSFDLCLTSPPYWDILNMKRTADSKDSKNYSSDTNDLGNISDYDLFLKKLGEIFEQVKLVLKPGGYCIVNVMDIRKKSNFYPLHSDLAAELKKIGYIYDDLIIWDRQADYNNMKTLGYPYKFRINKVHEYLLIFIKP